MKNKITPHKGGRISRLNVRILPSTKSVLVRTAKDKGVTVADVIELVFGDHDLNISTDARDGKIDETPQNGARRDGL